MKNKKFTVMLLTLALCVSVMFGCATTPETPGNGGGGTTNNPETPAPVYSAETLLNTLRGDIALSGKWSYKRPARTINSPTLKRLSRPANILSSRALTDRR